MKVKSFTFNPLMENSYVVYDETKSCAIIDPGCCCSAEEDELKAFIEKEGLKPVLLLNTHLHFDHIWGNPMVMREYGLKPKANVADKVFLDGGQLQFHGLPEDLNSLRFDVDWIGEGDKLTFGNTTLSVLQTPGHSQGSVCYYCSEDGALFSGDTLFRMSVGRSDFPGGSHESLLDSIYVKLFSLPDDTKIYTGHGPFSTIIDEKTYNPYV